MVNGIWRALGPDRPERTPAQVLNALAPTAWGYERLWRHRSLSLLSGRHYPLAEELDELIGWLDPSPGAVMVDVACSEGLYARALAKRGATVLAVDHSLAFLRAAQRRAAAAGVRIVPVQALAQHLPIVSGAAAATCMGGSLNEIGDRPTAIAEMGRVTAEGGRAFTMSLIAAGSVGGRIVQRLARPSGIHFPSHFETLADLQAAGFTVVHQRAEGVVLRIDSVLA